MFTLSGKNAQGEVIILDSSIPDDFAATHSAEKCGEVWPQYHDFVLTKNENSENQENGSI